MKKERRTREAKEVSETTSLKKVLEAFRSRMSMKVLKMKERKQEGQTSCEAGIDRRLMKMKKRRKAGKKGTKCRAEWEGEQKLEGIVERRRKEGSSLKHVKKVPELVVNGRMSQGKRVKSPKEKKVPGWSICEHHTSHVTFSH